MLFLTLFPFIIVCVNIRTIQILVHCQLQTLSIVHEGHIKKWNFRQQNWKQVAEFDEGEGVTNILVTEEEEEERENIVEL